MQGSSAALTFKADESGEFKKSARTAIKRGSLRGIGASLAYARVRFLACLPTSAGISSVARAKKPDACGAKINYVAGVIFLLFPASVSRESRARGGPSLFFLVLLH